MNKQLTEQIINHIFSNLMIINQSNFNNKKFKSLKSSDYLLNEKLSFSDEESNKIIKNSIWGVQLSFEKVKLKILLGDCSIDPDVLEYALLVSMDSSASYGLYSAYSINKNIDNDSLIALCVDNKTWLPTNIAIQASFLSGMENVKDIAYSMQKCEDYKEQHELLLSFIKYHNNIYGEL
jgi:hypothetical protein